MAADIEVTEHQVLTGTTQSTLHVRAGGVAVIAGKHQGTVRVDGGGRVEIPVAGVVQGTVSVRDAGVVVISGDLQGTVSVQLGGEVVIERSGLLVGTVSNYGTIVHRGVLGGVFSGEEPVNEGGKRLVPTIGADGSHSYNIPPRGRR